MQKYIFYIQILSLHLHAVAVPGTTGITINVDGVYKLNFACDTAGNNPQLWGVAVNGVVQETFGGSGQTFAAGSELALKAGDVITLRNMGTVPNPAVLRTIPVNSAWMQIDRLGDIPAPSPAENLAGLDRIETSLATATEEFKGNAPDAVVLATANDFPDALSGAGLAYKYNAPMLLINKTVSESKSVLDYITNNLSKGKNVYILGGTGAVSADISDYLTKQGYNVIRLGGCDRYETNQKIVENLNVAKGTSLVIATGNGFADALSISSVAASKGYPVFLSKKDSLSTNVINDIKNIQPPTIYIVGGTGVLSTDIEAQIKKINGNINIVRLGGNDRYETSMKIADYFNLDTDTITVATHI